MSLLSHVFQSSLRRSNFNFLCIRKPNPTLLYLLSLLISVVHGPTVLPMKSLSSSDFVQPPIECISRLPHLLSSCLRCSMSFDAQDLARAEMLGLSSINPPDWQFPSYLLPHNPPQLAPGGGAEVVNTNSAWKDEQMDWFVNNGFK